MSFSKQEIPQPVRHFNMHDDPLTNIETLHLLLWNKGVCVAGYDTDGNVLTTKVYLHQPADVNAVEAVFVNEPMVAGPQPVTHIWLADERNMIVPGHLHEAATSESWLRRFHFIEADERVLSTRVREGTAATVVFPAAEKLLQICSKYFTEAKIDALSGMVLCQENNSEKDSLDLVLLDTTAIWTLRRKGALLLHQVSSAKDIHDLVYAIGVACQHHGIDVEELQAILSGLCIREEHSTVLKSFFPKITIPGSEQFSSFTLLSKLISCAS